MSSSHASLASPSTVIKVEDVRGEEQNIRNNEAGSEPTAARPAVAATPHPLASAEPPFDGPTIPFDEKQASLTTYPPGCSVLHVTPAENRSGAIISLSLGVVQSVSFHVASKELLYHIVPEDRLAVSKDPTIALENHLLFAPCCPVKVEITDAFGTTAKNGTVLKSYQPLPSSEALYSIQEESGSLLHGIWKKLIKYRPPGEAQRTVEVERGSSASETDEPSLALSGHGEERCERRFYIPARVFRPKAVKDFFGRNVARLRQETNCEMRLMAGCTRDKTRSDKRGREDQMYIELSGAKSSVESAMSALEEALLGILNHCEKGRALYFFALLNEHRFKTSVNGNNEIVYQYCYHLKHERGLKYIQAKTLPETSDIVLDCLRGRNKEGLMRDFGSNCSLEINPHSTHPHYVIYGNDAETVGKCGKHIQTKLRQAVNNAIQSKRGQKRRRRNEGAYCAHRRRAAVNDRKI